MIIGRLRTRKSSSCLAPAVHRVIAAVLFASIIAPAMAQKAGEMISENGSDLQAFVTDLPKVGRPAFYSKIP